MKPRLATLKPRVQVLSTSRVNRLPVAPKPSQQPGYRIRGRELQRIRAEHFRRFPFCVLCLAKGHATPAVILDHIVALVNCGTNDYSNYQGLCVACSEQKTLADIRKSLNR